MSVELLSSHLTNCAQYWSRQGMSVMGNGGRTMNAGLQFFPRGRTLGTADAPLFADLFLWTSRPGNVMDALMGISSLLIV